MKEELDDSAWKSLLSPLRCVSRAWNDAKDEWGFAVNTIWIRFQSCKAGCASRGSAATESPAWLTALVVLDVLVREPFLAHDDVIGLLGKYCILDLFVKGIGPKRIKPNAAKAARHSMKY